MTSEPLGRTRYLGSHSKICSWHERVLPECVCVCVFVYVVVVLMMACSFQLVLKAEFRRI